MDTPTTSVPPPHWPPSVLNTSQIKKLALHYSNVRRNGRFTRVGKSFVDEVDARVRELVSAMVQRHPSIGETLKGE